MKKVWYILLGTLLYTSAGFALDISSFKMLVKDFLQNQLTRKQLIDAYEQLDSNDDRAQADLMLDEAHINSIVQLKEQEGLLGNFATFIELYDQNDLSQKSLIEAYKSLATDEDRQAADRLLNNRLKNVAPDRQEAKSSQRSLKKQEVRQSSHATSTSLPSSKKSNRSIQTPQQTKQEPSKPAQRGRRTQHHMDAAYHNKQRQRALLAQLEEQARAQEAAMRESAIEAQEQSELEAALKESSQLAARKISHESAQQTLSPAGLSIRDDKDSKEKVKTSRIEKNTGAVTRPTYQLEVVSPEREMPQNSTQSSSSSSSSTSTIEDPKKRDATSPSHVDSADQAPQSITETAQNRLRAKMQEYARVQAQNSKNTQATNTSATTSPPPAARNLSVSISFVGRPLFKEDSETLNPTPALFLAEFGKKSSETIIKWGEQLAEALKSKDEWRVAMHYFQELLREPHAPREKIQLLIETTNKSLVVGPKKEFLD